MKIKKYGILPNVAVLSYLQFSLIFLLAGCWDSSTKQDSSKLVMINVLDPDYYADCHIPGSINIPFEYFQDRIKTLDKNNHYVLYCSNYACTAAPFSASMLKDAGFEKVSFLPGGIVEWYQKGYPCTGSCAKNYLKETNEKLDDEDHIGVQVLSSDDLKNMIQI